MAAKITLTVTLENSEGFKFTDTAEEQYLLDPPSNQLEQHVKSITGGFRNMLQLMRASAPGGPREPDSPGFRCAVAANPKSHRSRTRNEAGTIPFRRKEKL